MKEKKNIFAIVGSASNHSSNLMLVEYLAGLTKDHFNLKIYNELKALPNFDPERSINNPPEPIVDFRNAIEQSDGVLICTPEYVFSIPSGLKNAIEWCVATTVFSDKPLCLVTASADGRYGHQELTLIMKTVMAKLSDETNLLIQGIKGKMDRTGKITDTNTFELLSSLASAFQKLIEDAEREKTSSNQT
ncbi:MAG: NADPH-dependent FMN reductase [Flavisolibacter sp.]